MFITWFSVAGCLHTHTHKCSRALGNSEAEIMPHSGIWVGGIFVEPGLFSALDVAAPIN